MTATITREDIEVFNVSNKFGFLNISDSDDEGDKIWQKAKKTNKQAPATTPNKKKPTKQSTVPSSSVIGMASSENIINPATQTNTQGLSKNAKRRLKKKKQAEAAKQTDSVAGEDTPEPIDDTPQPTEEELFQKQIQEVLKISKAETESLNDNTAPPDNVKSGTQSSKKSKKKKKKKPAEPETENGPEDEEAEEEEEEEEEDLFLPVIEDIKDVIKTIMKEDAVPITDIPIDNNQLLRKRALELQDINSEFKLKLNSLLRVGYKYKKKYDKETSKNKQLSKVINRCEATKKSADVMQKLIDHEEREPMLMKQIEELSEELEKERTKLHSLQNDRKGFKKVSFSET